MKKLTKKQRKGLIIAGAIALVVLIVFIWLKYRPSINNKKNTKSGSKPAPGQSSNCGVKKVSANNNTVFENQCPMMKDERICKIQSYFNKARIIYPELKTLPKLKEDCIYGEKTETAMQKWLGNKNVSYSQVVGAIQNNENWKYWITL